MLQRFKQQHRLLPLPGRRLLQLRLTSVAAATPAELAIMVPSLSKILLQNQMNSSYIVLCLSGWQTQALPADKGVPLRLAMIYQHQHHCLT
jgi:hypothetical protein